MRDYGLHSEESLKLSSLSVLMKLLFVWPECLAKDSAIALLEPLLALAL